MGVSGQHHAPTALSKGKSRYPLYRRLGGPQVGWLREPKYGNFKDFDRYRFKILAFIYICKKKKRRNRSEIRVRMTDDLCIASDLLKVRGAFKF